MKIKYLPVELQRIIYEYDDTYIVKFKTCIHELKFLYRVFPIKVNSIISNNPTFVYVSVTPITKLPELNRFIFDYCKRKQSLRSFKNYKLSFQ